MNCFLSDHQHLPSSPICSRNVSHDGHQLNRAVDMDGVARCIEVFQAWSNEQASFLGAEQVARLPQPKARRNLQAEGLERKCWAIHDSLSQEEQQSSQAHQTLARTSRILMLALKSHIEAARQMQMHQQEGAQSAQQSTGHQAGASGQQQSQQHRSSRVHFSQLMSETQRKVKNHTFFYPPSVVKEFRRAEDGLSEAKARFGQAIQKLQVAETKKEEFQRQAHRRLASGTPLTPPITPSSMQNLHSATKP